MESKGEKGEKMSILDVVIIALYLVMLMMVGVIVSKSVKSNEDSVVGGRSFGILTAAVGKTANMAGGPAVMGGTAYGYTFGVAGGWFGLANILGSWITAPFSPRIWRAMHRGRLVSVGGYLGYRFGTFARVFSGFLNLLAYAGFVAAQIVATGTILHVLLGWDLTISMILTTAVVLFYTILGGLKAVVYTDYIQLSIMIIGLFFILMPISVHFNGGLGEMMGKVPTAFTQIGSMGWLTIIGAILIPTMLAGFTMQASYTYIGACKSVAASWKSNLVAGVLYGLVAVEVIVIGMATFLLYPGLTSDQDALPTMIMNLLPHGLIGILLAAVLSATMSTASTCSLCAATCIGTDILRPLSKKDYSEVEMLRVTRISIALVALIALAFAVLYPQIVGLLLMGYSFGAGGLLIPIFSAMFWKRATAAGCIASMMGGGISYVLLMKMVVWPPLYVSVPLSLALMVAVSLLTPKPKPETYDIYFDDEWKKSGKEVN